MPYQPPALADQPPAAGIRSDIAPPSLLPLAQLGLRLLGVMLIVDGLGAVFGGPIQGILQTQAYAEAGYNVLLDPHSTGWAAGGVPCLIAGVYIIIGENWVLENVFTCAGHSAHDADTAPLLNSGELTDEREP